MQFCIRDDDTSFFTSPEELERIYGRLSRLGPISLAVVPFHRAGTSQGVPERYRRRWTVHPLADNRALVEYLRHNVALGRFEIMLHGCYHDEPDGQPEFLGPHQLLHRVHDGRRYLEDLLGARIRVFVPPRNAIHREGLRAIVRSGLQLGGTAGVRRGWRLFTPATWAVWFQLHRWRRQGGLGVPWVLDLGDHREMAGNAVTPAAHHFQNEAIFDSTLAVDGVFCAATHYWEQSMPSTCAAAPSVGEQLNRLVERATSNPRVVWRSVGDILCDTELPTHACLTLGRSPLH